MDWTRWVASTVLLLSRSRDLGEGRKGDFWDPGAQSIEDHRLRGLRLQPEPEFRPESRKHLRHNRSVWNLTPCPQLRVPWLCTQALGSKRGPHPRRGLALTRLVAHTPPSPCSRLFGPFCHRPGPALLATPYPLAAPPTRGWSDLSGGPFLLSAFSLSVAGETGGHLASRQQRGRLCPGDGWSPGAWAEGLAEGSAPPPTNLCPRRWGWSGPWAPRRHTARRSHPGPCRDT